MIPLERATVSTLIRDLQAILNKHGDIPVVYARSEYAEPSVYVDVLENPDPRMAKAFNTAIGQPVAMMHPEE